MKLPRRQFLHSAAGAAALPAMSRIAWAQAYPSRPITMVIGAPAGGPTDTIARIILEPMRASLGQAIIVENISGAAGTVGHGRVARAAPDGYTLSLGHWGTHVVNGVAYALQYDVQKDFEPVALICSNPFFFAAKRDFPPNDLQGLIAWMKANPGKSTEGTSGVGSPEHVAGILLQSMLGTNWQFVPYRGGGPKFQDLIAGQYDWTIIAPGALPLARNAGIKVYAIAAKSRSTLAPDVPTTDEAGLPGFYLGYWHGLWAPRATPKSVIAKINGAIVHALADARVRQRLAELGQEIFATDQQTPEGLAAFQKAEIEKWWPVLRAANIKGE